MEKGSMPILISGFVLLLLGAVLVGVVAEQEQNVAQKTAVENETIDITAARVDNATGRFINDSIIFTIANPPTDWKRTEEQCHISNYVVRNQSLFITTETTDYVFNDSHGTFNLAYGGGTPAGSNVFNGSDSNWTTWDYLYCDNYVTLGWGRTILNLVPGFFGLMLMAIAIGLFYKVMKQEGILGV